jgi:proteic killer suppression protein
VIRSFRSKDTEHLFNDDHCPRYQSIERPAKRKLEVLDAATTLADLANVPGNRFEALKGNRAGQYSVRINDQWRLCFRWADGDAIEVEIVDYH